MDHGGIAESEKQVSVHEIDAAVALVERNSESAGNSGGNLQEPWDGTPFGVATQKELVVGGAVAEPEGPPTT